ncbi:hypothetical protein BU15DRAFT_64686 [Melanogaster broomeanus]|nr:hypothetical protein BU15DRAFT_64686 [Melanogaster broomeanus]
MQYTSSLLPPSVTCPIHDHNEDWVFYYVNMFIDRDMIMRYRGGGVGHRSTREATCVLLHDQDVLDTLAWTTAALSGEDDGEESIPMDGDRRGRDEFEADEEALEEEVEEFGYTGIKEQELEGDGGGDSDDGGSSDGVDAVDDELGPEDGEDDSPEEYNEYGEL